MKLYKIFVFIFLLPGCKEIISEPSILEAKQNVKFYSSWYLENMMDIQETQLKINEVLLNKIIELEKKVDKDGDYLIPILPPKRDGNWKMSEEEREMR